MSTHVDQLTISVENFSPKLYVHSFELSAALNTIPIIQLDVLPIELGGKSAKKNLISASTPDIETITALYKKLLEYSIKNNVTATIKIEMIGKLKMSEKDQSITLKDWILTDVGLSTITNTAAPVLTVVFSHPVAKLNKTGSIYQKVMNNSKVTELSKDKAGNNIIEYMDNMYELYATSGDIIYYPTASLSEGGPSEAYLEKVMQLQEIMGENTPGKYIEANTASNIFLEYVNDGASGILKAALGRSVAPTYFGGSTWQKLVSEICPMQLTQIIPTYDKPKLLLEPCSPWQSSLYMLNTSVIQSMDTVSVDPAPVIGAAMLKDTFIDNKVMNAANKENKGSDREDLVKVCAYGFYFPEKALQSDILGEILNLGENELISSLATIDMNANSDKTVNSANGKTLASSGNSLSDRDRMGLHEAYAKAMFLINYRKYCKASVTTIPLFKDIYGKTIYPGRVITIADGSKDNKLFHGYIVRILIKGSVDGKGMTYIDLSHARPPDNSTLVDEGTENPCYPAITRDY